MGLPVIRMSEELVELLRHLHPELKKRFKAAFAMLLNDPACGKSLREDLAGIRSFRVRNMRIIYRLAPDGIIEVVAIGPRASIYEETFHLISRKENS